MGGGGRHLSLRLAQHGIQFKAIAFGGSDWAGELTVAGGPIAVAFRPFVNYFRGRKSVELQVCDWQPAAAVRQDRAVRLSVHWGYGAAAGASPGRMGLMFADYSFRAVRHEMLEQLADRDIRSHRVLSAMARVPRERFVPEGVRHLSYADRALPIACEQTISQPYIVALMSEALELDGSERGARDRHRQRLPDGHPGRAGR